MAKVIIPFRDRETWKPYAVGDDWEGSPERLEALSKAGFVQSGLIAHDGKENGSVGRTDAAESISADMTVAQLREVANSRGVEVPKRAKKADLLKLLGA